MLSVGGGRNSRWREAPVSVPHTELTFLQVNSQIIALLGPLLVIPILHLFFYLSVYMFIFQSVSVYLQVLCRQLAANYDWLRHVSVRDIKCESFIFGRQKNLLLVVGCQEKFTLGCVFIHLTRSWRWWYIRLTLTGSLFTSFTRAAGNRSACWLERD